jgi:membrane associated rhomboid family serine protease
MNIFQDLKIQYKTGDISQKIIFWNIAIFLVSIAFFYQFSLGIFRFPSWLALTTKPYTYLYFPWTLITYAFLHNGFQHLFFNMLILHFSSRFFLTFFTQKQYLAVYILGALLSGLVFVLSFVLLGQTNDTLVGASAAIIAILVAATTYQPLMNVRLLLIGNVKLWYITAVILILDLIQFQINNSGGHLAHLSGALLGFGYIKLLLNGTDLSQYLWNSIGIFENIFTKKDKPAFRKVYKNPTLVKTVKKETKVVLKDEKQVKIDAILDKISQSGYDSLTSEEKSFLFEAGK